MKRLILLTIAGLLAGALCLNAQPPMGGPMGPMGPQMRGGNAPKVEMPPILTPEEKTEEMAAKYNLTPEQKEAVLELNREYDGKLDLRMGSGMPEKSFEEMTEEERADFFSNMQTQMADMQTRIQDMQKSQKAYEKALKPILNKDQMKAYRKDQREREQQMSRAMGSQGGFPGGGFPGGGFPGGPGGFGGGFPGGPGGF